MAQRHKGTKRVEVGRNEWAVPAAGMRSIYQKVAGTVARHVDAATLELNATPQMLAYAGLTEAQAEELVSRWNAGERWM